MADFPQNLTSYFSLYGPFAILFVSLFYWTLRTYTERENLYRKEIVQLRAESEEGAKYHYENLSKFVDKYDLILTEIRDLKSQIERK